MATIKVRQNGPYLVEGDDVTLVDWNGAAYTIAKRPFALCRCGGSMRRVFWSRLSIQRWPFSSSPSYRSSSTRHADT